MMSSKKTSGNPFENSTQKWGTPKCRTHSPDDPNRRKKPIWTAQAIFDKNSDPYKNKVYFFSYKPLVEFDDIDAYGEDLKSSIEAANSVVESCKISGDIKIIKSKIKEDLCDTCPRFLACTHQESFPSTYEIHCVLRVKGCPYCGGPFRIILTCPQDHLRSVMFASKGIPRFFTLIEILFIGAMLVKRLFQDFACPACRKRRGEKLR